MKVDRVWGRAWGLPCAAAGNPTSLDLMHPLPCPCHQPILPFSTPFNRLPIVLQPTASASIYRYTRGCCGLPAGEPCISVRAASQQVSRILHCHSTSGRGQGWSKRTWTFNITKDERHSLSSHPTYLHHWKPLQNSPAFESVEEHSVGIYPSLKSSSH